MHFSIFVFPLLAAVINANPDAVATELLRQGKEPQRHGRALLLSRLFGRSARQCVNSEAKLREKLLVGGPIVLCRGSTITLQSAINIESRTFEMSCEAPRLFRRRNSKCIISGDEKTSLFTGNPLSANIEDIVFRDALTIDRGGAFLMDSKSATSVVFTRCSFIDNQAGIGGALFIGGLLTRVTIQDCLFDRNRAVTGGAINLVAFPKVSIVRTTWLSNQSNKEGSAIAANIGCAIQIEDSRILNGTSINSGAAVFMHESTLDLKSTVFVGNRQGTRFVDVLINDDKSPERGGSFVNCDVVSPVNFCNGKSTIVENTLDGDVENNENCKNNGLVDATASACIV